MSARTTDIHRYTELQIETASQRRLICILHEQCVLQLRNALREERSVRRPFLDKSQNILVILQRALQLDDATSRGLYHLYDYCYCRLESNETAEIRNALRVLEVLSGTFGHLMKHP